MCCYLYRLLHVFLVTNVACFDNDYVAISCAEELSCFGKRETSEIYMVSNVLKLCSDTCTN